MSSQAAPARVAERRDRRCTPNAVDPLAEKIFQIGIKALIEDASGKILLVHNPGQSSADYNFTEFWDLPGGRITEGDVESTLIREVDEEIGVKEVKIGELFDASISKMKVRGTMDLFLVTYRCSIPDGTAIRVSEEHDSYEWFNRLEAGMLLSKKFSDSFLQRLQN